MPSLASPYPSRHAATMPVMLQSDETHPVGREFVIVIDRHRDAVQERLRRGAETEAEVEAARAMKTTARPRRLPG